MGLPPGTLDTGIMITDKHSVLDIKSAISKAIETTVPQGSKGAVFGIADSNGNAHIILASRIGDTWNLAGSLDKDGKAISGKLMVSKTW